MLFFLILQESLILANDKLTTRKHIYLTQASVYQKRRRLKYVI